MKVDALSIAYIQNVVATAQLVKIDDIIIEPDLVRGIDEDRSVVIIQTTDVPAMPFTSIGLNRIGVFMNRFKIAKDMADFEIEAIMPNLDSKQKNSNVSSTFARALVLKGKGIKIDYRCANPDTIQAPKSLNDKPKHKVPMTAEAVLLMSKAQSAMGSDEITLTSQEDGVSFEMADMNSDVFSYKFGEEVTVVDKDADRKDTNFTHKYPIKILLPLLKVSSDEPFLITSRGILKIVVNGLDFYILPRV
jgi:hypothetical protein